MKVMWESLMLRNLLWANFKETCDPPKFSMQDLHKLFLRLRKEKELYESSSAFGEALPTLIIQQIIKTAGLWYKKSGESYNVMELLKEIVLMQKYYQLQDKNITIQSEGGRDLDPAWQDLKNSFSPVLIGCLNKEYLMNNALMVALQIKREDAFKDWALGLLDVAYSSSEMADDQEKLRQVSLKIERYSYLLQQNQQVIEEYLRENPGDQPDDAMKREKVEITEKLGKYQKQQIRFSKKLTDGQAFQLLILRGILRCAEQV